MKFARPVFLLASGAILIVSGFAYDLSFAGLPYQDPTPAIQETWLFHKRMADRIVLTGATVLAVGCVWQAFRWILRLSKRQHSD